MVTIADYSREATEACLSVLMELMTLLGEDRVASVVIGGLVPRLLLGEMGQNHAGTLDIDLALDAGRIPLRSYRTILQRLQEHGYEMINPQQPFRFSRVVGNPSGAIRVEVDFLASPDEGAGKGHRHQRIQGLQAHKLPGCDLAFQQMRKVRIQGVLPEGGTIACEIQVADAVPFLVLKGLALAQRMKAKDAYDIYYVIRYVPGGALQLVELFQPFLTHDLVRQALQAIADRFATLESVGPLWVADFYAEDGETRQIRLRDAFERVNQLVEALGFHGLQPSARSPG